jgi:hypothetical protein
MRITNAGNVGIGTTSPSTPLHVKGDDGIRIENVSLSRAYQLLAYTGGGSPNANFRIYDATAGADRLNIDTSGRVLVGTSIGTRRLTVADAHSAGNITDVARFSTTGGFATGSGASIEFGIDQATYPDWTTGQIASTWIGGGGWGGLLRFYTNDDSDRDATVEAMRINQAQELLIGYTSDNGAYKLQVNSQIFATSATVATSDGRYKENVASLGGCLDLVKALRPVSFTWKPQEDITRTDDDGNEVLVREGHNFPEGTQVGFIAQEVQEVLTDKPWLNSVIKENVRPAVLDDEGNELAPEEQFFGIAEGNLIAVLTNALQEAVAQIETLSDRVAALEAQ